MKALLYRRVSTQEQERKGYSLIDQRETLLEHCQKENIEVLGEFEDVGSSANLIRHGMDDLRRRVSEGDIDLVIALKRDRFGRGNGPLYILQTEFKSYGTLVQTVLDPIDNSPEGNLFGSIKDSFSEYERALITDRTVRGRLAKARAGKVPGGGKPPYGYRYEDGHLYVVEDQMAVVREIIEMVSEGKSRHAVVTYLNNQGLPSPGGKRWTHTTVKRIIEQECYLGTLWYNRDVTTREKYSEVVDGERIYRTRVTYERRPEEEWIGIPVPDCGLPAETIARARDRIKDSPPRYSKNSDRVWELSGGIARCPKCGRRFTAYSSYGGSSPGPNRKRYYYYYCHPSNGCDNSKKHSAAKLEERVGQTLQEVLSHETWVDMVDNLYDQKLKDLKRLNHSPTEKRDRLYTRKEKLSIKLDRYMELWTDGDITKDQYREKKSQIQGELQIIDQELGKLQNIDSSIRRLELQRSILSSIAVFSDGEPPIDDEGHPDTFSIFTNPGSAKSRRDLYQQLGMRVVVGEELEISFDAVLLSGVSKIDHASIRRR